MISGLLSAISGIDAQSLRMDVASNNIANATTPGYRSQRVSLTSAGENQGVQVLGTTSSTYQGALMRSGISTDLAIGGQGFFQVEDADGNTYYTRSGNFTQDADGYIRTLSGEYLLGDSGRVQLPADTASFSIAQDGTVTATDNSGNNSVIGTITLALFDNENGLLAQGNNLYSPSDASGTAMVANPGENGSGYIISGALELSNVDYVSEMVNMMLAQRGLEANVKTLQTADEMLRELTRLRE